MNKNYFSDITELFLKVKKEENIQIDETAKADIRKMLQSKISEMKTGDTYERLEPLAPEKSFWSMWKNQLIGVPASLAAIALVVYAASNINVSIPKEDFSPTRDTQTNVTQVELKEPAQPYEFDRPLVKTAKGTLVIDYSEEEQEDRSLNKIKSTPQEIVEEDPVVFKTLKIEYSDQATFILDDDDEEEAENEPAQEEKTEAKVEEELNDPFIATEETTVVTDSLDADIPLEVKETQELVPVTEIAEPVAQVSQYFPVYTYKDAALKNKAAFTEEKLAKLTRSKTPESVTVYYVEDRQVVVEIEEKGITKWYLFDNIDGTWTISRYEKYVTGSVVK